MILGLWILILCSTQDTSAVVLRGISSEAVCLSMADEYKLTHQGDTTIAVVCIRE